MDLIRAGADSTSANLRVGDRLGREGAGDPRRPPAEVADLSARVRDRNQQRLQLELASGLEAGKALFRGNAEL